MSMSAGPAHYGDLIAAGDYLAASADGAAWLAATEVERGAALIRASRGLDGQYGARFPGAKAGGRAQILAWPRTGAVDRCAQEPIPEDEIPREIVEAAYVLALAELTAPGGSTPTVVPGEAIKRAKGGSAEVEYFGPGDGVKVDPAAMRPVMLEVEGLLCCILTPEEPEGGIFGLMAIGR